MGFNGGPTSYAQCAVPGEYVALGRNYETMKAVISNQPSQFRSTIIFSDQRCVSMLYYPLLSYKLYNFKYIGVKLLLTYQILQYYKS